METDATRRDEPVPGGSHLDGAPAATRRDDAAAGTPFTHRDDASQDPAHTVRDRGKGARDTDGEDRLQRALPSALAARFRTVREMRAAGAEADMLLVESLADGTRYVAKIYRLGIEPKTTVLERIAASAPDHVIRLFEHGESDGRWFELLEYAPDGSLRDLIDREGPRVDGATVREVVAELVSALAYLHARNVVHRDLKPDNVLIRRRGPLDLVLTDFGISSVVESSLHFSANANRTVRYAAPEALTGAVSPALDYWSLGISLVEMLTGRHPFAGVSDLVLAKHLSTKPVPLEAVEGEGEWRTLCRGLLTRDDRKRWGRAEIERWLAGDRTLTVPVDEEAPAAAARPYELAGEVCPDAPSLARALARHWRDGERELARGYIREWTLRDLGDTNLTRFLDDQDTKSLAIDIKLFQVITRFAPDLPSIYRDHPLTGEHLRELAVRAVSGDSEVQNTIARVQDGGLLSFYGRTASHQESLDLEEQWQRAVSDFESARARAAEVGAPAIEGRLSREQVLSHLLLAVLHPEYLERLRGEALSAAATIRGDCPWFVTLGEPRYGGAGALLLMTALGPAAIEEAKARRLAAQRNIRAAAAVVGTTIVSAVLSYFLNGQTLALVLPLLIAAATRIPRVDYVVLATDWLREWAVARRRGIVPGSGWFARNVWSHVLSGLLELDRVTAGISDPHLRAAVRVAGYLYYAAFIVGVALLVGYVVAIIVAVLIALALILWLISIAASK